MKPIEIKLSNSQLVLHQKAIALSQTFRKCEYELIEVLREVDQVKLFRHLGYASLFRYAVDELKLSESQTYSFITVARKSIKIQSLAQSLKAGTLTVSKASRIASCLNSENANDLISFAKTHTSREIDLEVSKRNPKKAKRQSVRLESDKSVRLAVSLSSETYEKIMRVQDLLAQKGKSTDLTSTIDTLLDEYLKRHDPVVKAKRVLSKQKKQKASFKSSSEYVGRNKESTASDNQANNIEPHTRLNQMTLSKQNELLNSEPESNSQAKKEFDVITFADAKALPRQSEAIGIQNNHQRASQSKQSKSQFGKPTPKTLSKLGRSRYDKSQPDPKTLPTQSLSQISRSKLASKTLSKQSDLVEYETSNSMATREGSGVAASRSETNFINAKSEKTSPRTSKLKRQPIPASIKHQVYLKHEGRCSFVDARGERCTNSRYLHIHHIRPVSVGGGNKADNLTLLCASHHELVHQLSFPIEGQVSWIRSTVKEYMVG